MGERSLCVCVCVCCDCCVGLTAKQRSVDSLVTAYGWVCDLSVFYPSSLRITSFHCVCSVLERFKAGLGVSFLRGSSSAALLLHIRGIAEYK
jgi:hypothetical protein